MTTRGEALRTLAVLSNIPTPYRGQFFERLQEALRLRGARLAVAYCARSEWNRQWPYFAAEHRYQHRILPGRSPKIGSITCHLNPAVVSFLKQERPDWLLSAGAWNMPTGLLALSQRRRLGFRAIFWSEGHADSVLHPTGPIAWARRWVSRRYDAFAVPNSRSASYLRSEIGEPVRCLKLPNTIDVDFFTPGTAEERREVRRSLGFRHDDVLFVQVSQLEDRKGVDELFAAFTSITNRDPRAKCVIVGTGTREAVLRSRYAEGLARGNLRLPGAVGAAKVRDWLRAADVFVLATKRDPNPLSPIEAASCGKPIIVSRFAGNSSELVLGPETGSILSEVSAVAIEEVAMSFLRRPSHVPGSVCPQIRAQVVKNFSSTSVANELVEQLLALNWSEQ